MKCGYRYLKIGISLSPNLKIYPAIQEMAIDRNNETAKIIYGDASANVCNRYTIGMWMHIILSDKRPTNAKHFVTWPGMNDLNVSP